MPFKDKEDEKAYQKAYREKNKRKAKEYRVNNASRIKKLIKSWNLKISKGARNCREPWTIREIRIATEMECEDYKYTNKDLAMIIGRSYAAVYNMRRKLKEKEAA